MKKCDLIGRQLKKTTIGVRKLLNHYLDDYSLGDGQFSILYIVYSRPGISQDEICKEKGVDKATIAKAVKKMITNGYIYREKSEKDKRVYCLYCTKKGLKFIPELKKVKQIQVDVLTKGFEEEEIEQLSSYLERMRGNICEHLSQEKEK